MEDFPSFRDFPLFPSILILDINVSLSFWFKLFNVIIRSCIDLNFDETKLRITAQGEKIANDEIISAGPIHDTQFYEIFFKMLENEIENQY